MALAAGSLAHFFLSGCSPNPRPHKAAGTRALIMLTVGLNCQSSSCLEQLMAPTISLHIACLYYGT